MAGIPMSALDKARQQRANNRENGSSNTSPVWIMPDELATFNECFITGTAAEVTPVGEIAGIHYTPGNLTMALIDDYSSAVNGK